MEVHAHFEQPMFWQRSGALLARAGSLETNGTYSMTSPALLISTSLHHLVTLARASPLHFILARKCRIF
eukprot:940763-Amphidinium_carterae.1